MSKHALVLRSFPKKIEKLIASHEKAAAKGFYRSHTQDPLIQPTSYSVRTRRFVSINMVCETVTARILKPFPSEIGGPEQPVDRQLQHSSTAQKFARDGGGSSGSVMEFSHCDRSIPA